MTVLAALSLQGLAVDAGSPSAAHPAAAQKGLAPPSLAAPPPPAVSPAEALKKRAAAFSRFRTPLADKTPRAVGSYANGCVIGATALPASGANWEVLHLDRHRRFGHPALIAFIRRLAASARKSGIGPLLIGDLSQPRGGPTPYGHRSHQSGLDVDIGFTTPSWMKRRKPSAKEREEMMPPVVVDLKARAFTKEWGPKVDRLVELAALDPAVERVFVNPLVKDAMCKRRRKNREFLRVVRPWTYHHDHLHARLKCPTGSSACEAQTPIGPGDGCDEVARALEAEARRLREPPPPPPTPRPPVVPRPPPPLPPLPAECQAMIGEAAPPVAASGPRATPAVRDP